MKKLSYIFIALVTIACGEQSFQTENGTEVSYLKKGDGVLPVDSLVSIFRIRYTTEEGKVMLDADEPMPLRVDPNSEVEQGELFEVLKQLKTGDSVGFDLLASELFEKTFRIPRPDSIPADSKIKFQVSFIDQLTETGYFDMLAKKEAKTAEKQMSIDTKIIDEYLKENQIEAITTENGLKYTITEEGYGAKPDSGQVIKVNYTGWILNGDYFDSSIEEVAKEKGVFTEGRIYEPFTFPIEQGKAIKGWDEGLALLNKGAKARLYIPSPLGYGSQNRSPVIKANSILVFDVELLDIIEE